MRRVLSEGFDPVPLSPHRNSPLRGVPKRRRSALRLIPLLAFGLGIAPAIGLGDGGATTAASRATELARSFPAHPPVTAPSGAPRSRAELAAALVSGPFINFESPPVKPLALSADGLTLAVANTPDGSVALFDTTGDQFTLIDEVPVGLDPVTVAFEPGSVGPRVWVANMVSDDVSVIDVGLGRVVDVVALGEPRISVESATVSQTADEPVNILFEGGGGTAFVVSQDGTITAIDTTTRQIVGTLDLDCHKPRAGVMRRGQLVVAALHSGNRTTLVGRPVELRFTDGSTRSVSSLGIVSRFSLTRDRFESSMFAPWPDVPTQVTEAAPRVERIVDTADVPIAGGNGWREIVEVIDDGTGAVSQEAIDQLNADAIAITGSALDNAEEILQFLLDEAAPTIDHDLIVIDVSDPAAMSVADEVGGVGTSLTGMGIDPATDRLFISNLEPRNRVRHEPALTGHFIDHQVVIADDLDAHVFTVTDLHAGVANFNDTSFDNLEAQAASLAHPEDVVFKADGSRAYVAALGPDRVGVLDGATAEVIARVDVGRGPRGLAIDTARDRLFVLNRTDHTITMLDTSTDAPAEVATVALFNPEPAAVTEGRPFLYSTRFSNNFGSSCALCHLDGRRDHLSWDLGDPDGEMQPGPVTILPDDTPGPEAESHPLKGPMVTQTLQGLAGHNPYHWRGDKPGFVDFNGAFVSLLGGNELTAADMDRYRDFVDTIVFPANPYRDRRDLPLDDRAGPDAGEAAYLTHCDRCHMADHDGAGRFPQPEADFGAVLRTSGTQTHVVRQLRGVYQKLKPDLYNGFGITHAGATRRGAEDHQLKPLLQMFPNQLPTDDDVREMIAFLSAFSTNVRPVVGWQIMPHAPVTQVHRDDLDLMIERHEADPSECDVVVQGVVSTVQRSYVLQADSNPATFERDDGTLESLDELLTHIDAGDPLVFMAVPPGSGRRIAFDEGI